MCLLIIMLCVHLCMLVGVMCNCPYIRILCCVFECMLTVHVPMNTYCTHSQQVEHL